MNNEARPGGVWRGGFTGPPEPCPRQYDEKQFQAWKDEGHDSDNCQLFDLRIAEPVCDCWRAEQALRDRLQAENERLKSEIEAGKALLLTVLAERDGARKEQERLRWEVAKLTGMDR